ncbi:tyrosine-type recombinase/integrase [Myceligenerans crystallogenes]|uniref:Tyr recombinase domain-containing protein n=1 Tax=Myceligenerans crystallogenes TaxID=316335 RepID=A0ABN2NAM4_9MICO
MSIQKTANGRFKARLKSGREYLGGKTFDTRGEAVAWLRRERAALAGGIDPRAGREKVRVVLERWLKVRRNTVAAKTYKADADLQRLMPTSLLNMHLSAVSDREVARSFELLLAGAPARSKKHQGGRAPERLTSSAVVRYRASLSAFFGWCVREKLIAVNPVTNTRVPKSSEEAVEMNPFTETELERAYADWTKRDARLADILLVMGWTGLRWGEARALQVADFVEVPTPGLMVRRNQPEGIERKRPKGGRSRRVPLANRVLPIVRDLAQGKAPDELLLTTMRGATLHRSAVLRALAWETTGRGRRLHDLRHTAACLWLARRVDLATVQAWCGHESAATTNRYLHFLGTGADMAGLERLNDGRGNPGGTRDASTGS